MALTVNTNFQDDTIFGIRDADFAKEAFQVQSGADSFNCDDILLGHGAVHPDTPIDTHPNDLFFDPGGGLALTDYRPEVFSEGVSSPAGYTDIIPAIALRSDNRFVFEPLNAMTSFGDSIDPGLDGANGFKPREVAAVEIGEPPDPKLWLQMLG